MVTDRTNTSGFRATGITSASSITDRPDPIDTTPGYLSTAREYWIWHGLRD
ncbi:hypothetical protein ACQPW1_30015 [Nocardia sp. CA-128927]|uniref:hypothetical protein n=1 Tax=Nocardia sp. CA-128927 TaxID=3239975 RepID=UPI003D97F9F9